MTSQNSVRTMVGPYHPSFTVTVMPPGWEGRSIDGKQQAGNYRKSIDSLARVAQSYPPQYWGHTDPVHSRLQGFFFGSTVGHAGWRQAHQTMIRLFHLVNAE